jgi:hypothetical protein
LVGESCQQVLASFATTGSVTASYSANITASAVPEPATLMLIGLGLLLMLPACSRKLSSLRVADSGLFPGQVADDQIRMVASPGSEFPAERRMEGPAGVGP